MTNVSVQPTRSPLLSRKKSYWRSLGVVFAMLASLALANMARAADELYVFGDSLSDTGNLASVSGAFPNPPFAGNRVTNGLTAVEVLAAQLGTTLTSSLHLIGPAQGTNYAVAGAKASTSEPIDLNTQVDAFLLNSQGQAPADALYMVFIGGNDVRAARDAGDFRASNDIINGALDNVKANLEKLIAAGAKNIMVVNVPDIGAIPETQQLAAATGNWFLPTIATVKTAGYNLGLKHRVKRVERQSGLDIILVDLFGAFSDFIKDSQAYGYTNTTEPCFSQSTQSFTAGCNFGQNFDKYVYFDEIHPTAKTHQRAGRVFFSYAP